MISQNLGEPKLGTFRLQTDDLHRNLACVSSGAVAEGSAASSIQAILTLMWSSPRCRPVLEFGSETTDIAGSGRLYFSVRYT
jgi:hypothetical protein